ncbi:hypothetical protein [Pseudohongiella sp.]|uniref:Uncharacterized protein n=1 Tax=marine sediment metagenome TaxID=412755 RepID=A0A0F9WDP8_9ZZZZ|nr:hypothetical protein [Pseudohongiella sp.]HDZ09795.1 hypothetical protein [Pseudohongiella sp.]HEA61591.1 hypothetical protein [Pseudohongiella sp.]
MANQQSWLWIKDHLEEIATAGMTAFFTALMFRVGLGMLFSIVMGLVLAYSIRILLLKTVRQSIFRRLAGSGTKPDPARTDSNDRL